MKNVRAWALLVGVLGGCDEPLMTEADVGQSLQPSVPLAQLDAPAIELFCESESRTIRRATDLDATDLSCLLSAIGSARNAAWCEEAFADCMREVEPTLWIDALCDETRPVPECDPSHTIGEYRECSARLFAQVDWSAVDCRLAGTEGADALFAALAPPEGCEWIDERECALYRPLADRAQPEE